MEDSNNRILEDLNDIRINEIIREYKFSQTFQVSHSMHCKMILHLYLRCINRQFEGNVNTFNPLQFYFAKKHHLFKFGAVTDKISELNDFIGGFKKIKNLDWILQNVAISLANPMVADRGASLVGMPMGAQV